MENVLNMAKGKLLGTSSADEQPQRDASVAKTSAKSPSQQQAGSAPLFKGGQACYTSDCLFSSMLIHPEEFQ